MHLIMSFRDPDTEPIKKVSIIISKGSLEGIYPGLIMANGARADNGDAFALDMGKFRQIVDHAGNGEDFAFRGVNILPQSSNGRQQGG